MKCSVCGKSIEQNYYPSNTIIQCVECYWLIAYQNGNQIADKKMGDDEMFTRVLNIAKQYPQCVGK